MGRGSLCLHPTQSHALQAAMDTAWLYISYEKTVFIWSPQQWGHSLVPMQAHKNGNETDSGLPVASFPASPSPGIFWWKNCQYLSTHAILGLPQNKLELEHQLYIYIYVKLEGLLDYPQLQDNPINCNLLVCRLYCVRKNKSYSPACCLYNTICKRSYQVFITYT